ncbi:hypothetical protein [Sphingomonas melonis]|uniref:hypothetical protein n=1 Tax=Sphingomonas melonis TaxID=152682 RepID=UPI0035C87793
MTAIALVITRAGLERFTAAQLADDIDLTIATVGLTEANFVVSPTLTALPGEFSRLAMVSGTAASDHIVHLTIRDDGTEHYLLRGFGLFLADGTLFAVHGQADPIVEKSARTSLYFAVDVAFPTGNAEALTFGNTNFLNPPATRTTAGVAKAAAPADLVAGTDDSRFVTPLGLSQLLPLRTVVMWWGSADGVPVGWAICNGQTVARSDGLGMIKTPDFEGQVPAGAGRDPWAWGAKVGDRDRRIRVEPAGKHKPTGRNPAHAHEIDLSTNAAPTGIDLDLSYKTDTAGGGSDRSIKSASITDGGHAHAVQGTTETLASIELEMDEVADHDHEVFFDVVQPSLAIYFIMRV